MERINQSPRKNPGEQQRMLLASSPAGVSMLTSLPPAEPNSIEDIVMAQAEFATTLREAWNRKP